MGRKYFDQKLLFKLSLHRGRHLYDNRAILVSSAREEDQVLVMDQGLKAYAGRVNGINFAENS